jgi:hypothetical protein
MLDDKLTTHIAVFQEKCQQGVSLKDIILFIVECVETLIYDLKYVGGLPQEDIIDIVSHRMVHIYRTIQPIIPFIPEPFELWFETFMLHYLVPALTVHFLRKKN